MTPENGRNGREELDPSVGGPFSMANSHDRPWVPEEVEHGPFERRRATDRRASELVTALGGDAAEDTGESESEQGRRRRWGRRRSDVLGTDGTVLGDSRRLARKLREPLIGLALAGVAAPLINAGMNPTAEPGEAEAGDAVRGETAGATADLEEGVANRWAEAEEATVREQTIQGAMTRYGIDQDLAEQIYEAAERHEIEPEVAYGLVNTESTFRDRAVSHVGARGLTQVMPRTAKWLDPTVSTGDLFNRDTNLDLGFKYLRMMIDKYGGNVENALTAYNRGPGTVDRILDRGGNPDNGYAGKVLGG